MEYWYTLHTKPNAEYQVASSLQARNITTYLPEIRQAKSRRGRSTKPFFPCYLFAKIDLSTVGLSYIRWTPGLRRLVAFGDEPVPLKDETIDVIRRQVERIAASGGAPTHPFKPGDTVRITEGPFKDMLAVFDQQSSPAERVRVLLNLLGHASRLQISVSNLAKMPDQAEVATPRRPSRRTRGRGRRIKPS